MVRDFTYVDDVIENLIRLLEKPAVRSAFNPQAPNPSLVGRYRVFNIGNSNPTPLMEYIHALEQALGITAEKQMMPMQPGDVQATAADTSALEAWVNFRPNTPVKEGVTNFVAWYRKFYGI